MKLDLNACWDQAMRLVGLNREVMLVLGGTFFFLPYAIFMILVPIPDFAALAGPNAQANEAAMSAALNGFVTQYWWAILLLALAQTAGALAVMAIVGDHTRPTVGAAVSRGLRLMPTAVAAQLLTTFAAVLIGMVVIVIGAILGSKALAITLAIMVIPLMVWLFTRLSLTNPAIAIEDKVNPLAAMVRSWRLTKGNSLRLAIFYILIVIAFFVISQVAGLLIGLLAALPGPEAARIITAVLSGIVSSVMTVIIYAVMASVHRQLARAERTSALDPV